MSAYFTKSPSILTQDTVALCVAVSRNDDRIAAGYGDGKVVIWKRIDAAEDMRWEVICNRADRAYAVRTIAFYGKNDSLVLSTCADNTGIVQQASMVLMCLYWILLFP